MMDYPIGLRDESLTITRSVMVSLDEEISLAAHHFGRKFPVEADLGFFDVYQHHIYLAYFLIHQSAVVMALGDMLKIKVVFEQHGRFTVGESYIQNNPVGSYEEFETSVSSSRGNASAYKNSAPYHSVAVPHLFQNWAHDLCIHTGGISSLNHRIMDHAHDLQGVVASKIDRVWQANSNPAGCLAGYDALNTLCSASTTNIFAFHFSD